jgi:uncharacterized membrane protein
VSDRTHIHKVHWYKHTHTHTHTYDSHSDRHEFSIHDELVENECVNIMFNNSEFHSAILYNYLLLVTTIYFLIRPIHYKVKKAWFDVE